MGTGGPTRRKKRGFVDLAVLGVTHFKNPFAANEHDSIGDMLNILKHFLRLVNQKENKEFFLDNTLEEISGVINSLKKDRCPNPNGWTIDFFQYFFDTIGKDLLLVLEEIRKGGNLKPPLNSMFLALIPKTDLPVSFEDLWLIALCNSLYKIHSKIIAICTKPLLSNYISHEQFGIIKGRLIHEAIGTTKEGLHTIKFKKKEVVVLKIDLSKDFDRVS
jgi:hypothetical protein